jgi:bacillithiol biosynthesis deacetylase BshB1
MPLPPTDPSEVTPVDLLAFGPHPADIEIGMAGTVAKHVRAASRVGLCDLSRGELGSNGTPEERVEEGLAAARALGASWRLNLGLPDGVMTETDEHVRRIVDVVRRARPRAIAIPFGGDRHPDHVAAHRLLVASVFKAGLRRYETAAPPWHAEWTVSYFINDSESPSFLVDVSDVYDLKRAALACHRSQFAPSGDGAAATRLTSPLFLQLVESRDAQFGARAGVRFAEGFIVREPVLRALLTDRWPGVPTRP